VKSLGDAIALRNRLIAHLEEADTDCAREQREQPLTFVVAGGGFAGVETIAAVNDFLRQASLVDILHAACRRAALSRVESNSHESTQQTPPQA
jgi:NADH dehydrogenase FAD-containing subunit